MLHTLSSPERLAFPGTDYPSAALGQCQQCGFCTLHCPTFLLTRDERDSPRGRVRFAAEILGSHRAPSPEAVLHLDRCLTCLGCTSACPFGVDHRRLWDESRAVIERSGVRPIGERIGRRALAQVLTSRKAFGLLLRLAPLGRALRPVLPAKLRRMTDLAPKGKRKLAAAVSGRTYAALGARRMRVALLAGCVQQSLGTDVDTATVNLLTRHGCEVVVPEGSGCCGAIHLHFGLTDSARRLAVANIVACEQVAREGGLDAVVANASGCGSVVKDYGSVVSPDPQYRERAARLAAMTRDVCEVLSELSLNYHNPAKGMTVALHVPCSMQHGQGIAVTPEQLLADAGFAVWRSPDAHLCCGSAGTYSLLEPDMADRLGSNKGRALDSTAAQVIATGNIGCMLHIARFANRPVVHLVELLDWATGGTRPGVLDRQSR